MTLNQGATNLRRALEDPNGFIVAPGVYDGLSARLALAAGFDALYMVCPYIEFHDSRTNCDRLVLVLQLLCMDKQI